jgi:cytochrome oxidase Cu insertion factor (SCO1/SenC/PrrC family)
MLAGPGLALLGVAAYAVQLSLGHLMLPWYMPAAAIVGVVLLAASLCKRRTIWRVLALVLVMLLAGFEIMALSAMRLPPYTGPIAIGRSFPAFEARRADGTPFTQNDLIGDQHHAIVFFRGRW